MPNGWMVGRFAPLSAIPSIVHAVTTRQGLDVNLAKNNPHQAAPQVATAMGLASVAYCKQVHAGKVLAVDKGGFAGEVDALAANTPSLGLMCFSADCPLILAADAAGTAIGIAHASWRGTAAGIAMSLVELLTGQFSARAKDLVACICPSAGPCCYEVGTDVLDALGSVMRHADRFFIRRDGKMFMDLWAANRQQLLDCGLARKNIHAAGLCTICRNDILPSYRLEGANAGRFVAVIGRR